MSAPTRMHPDPAPPNLSGAVITADVLTAQSQWVALKSGQTLRLLPGIYKNLSLVGTKNDVAVELADPANTTLNGSMSDADPRPCLAIGGNLTRVRISLGSSRTARAKLRKGWDGVKWIGSVTDVFVTGVDIAETRNQGSLSVADGLRVWYVDFLHTDTGDGPLDDYDQELAHSAYYGGSGSTWVDGVIQGKIVSQRTGYGVQFNNGVLRTIICSSDFNVPGHAGARDDIGVAIIVDGTSRDNVVVNTVGRQCRHQLVGAGAASPPNQPVVWVRSCGEIGRGSWWPDGQVGSVVGSTVAYLSDADLVGKGDAAFALPWDTAGGRNIGLPSVGATPPPPPPPPPPPVDPCADVKAQLTASDLRVKMLLQQIGVIETSLGETSAALTASTTTVEQARELCRAQITGWRTEKPARSWAWIRKQPAAQAFYGPLGGS